MSMAIAERLQDELIVPGPDFDSFLKYLGWDLEQVMRGEFPPGCDNLMDLQLACIASDGYLWCQAFLQEPTDENPWGKKDPYNFFDYQIPSIRYKGSFVHYDGSETGKTRELIAKVCYLSKNTPGGSGLIGAPETDQLEPILEGILDQFESGELKGSIKKHKQQPHHTIALDNGFTILLRPSKHDGKTYRSKHVKTFAFRDEAAKDSDIRTWTEFYRAKEPGCILGVYSVPDGRRETEFYRLGQTSKAMSKDMEYPSDNGGWLSGKIDPAHYRHFHWPKTLMPEPFWGPARKREKVEEYNGEDSQGYKHNVLGIDGDPESTIFPSEKFEQVVKEISEYVSISILVNEKIGDVSLEVYGIEKGVKVSIDSRTIPLVNFDVRETLNKYLSHSKDIAEYFMGGDLGYAQDFAEFWVKAVIGERNRLVVRVHMLGVRYNHMREAWNMLDDIFDCGRNTMRSGVDVGGAGTAFYHELVGAYPSKYYEERCAPVQFGGKAEVLGPDGEPILDHNTEKPIRRRIKTLATDMLVKRMQELTNEYPADSDLVRDFTGHTSRPGQDGDVIYSGKNDHTIDADRAGTWAYYRAGQEYPEIEGFSSGVPLAASGGELSGGSSGVFLT